MIQVTFSLKYQNQLRRTRPQIYSNIEKEITDCVRCAGGKLKKEYRCIIAVFNEEIIGFWIDLLTIVETIQNVLRGAERDLYGHICMISSFIDDEQLQILMRTLPAAKIKSGIWCTLPVQQSLSQLLIFNDPYTLNDDSIIPNTFVEVKSVINTDDKNQYPLRKLISKILKQDTKRNTVLIGKNFIGKRDCLQWYSRDINNGTAPLTIRFGSWGQGLSCFADAYSPALQKLIDDSGVTIPAEVDKLYEMLFNERLRIECSKFSLEKGKNFLSLLTNIYFETCEKSKLTPIIVLENIQSADEKICGIFLDVYQETIKDRNAVLYGTCTLPEIPAFWKKVFSSSISCNTENIPVYNNSNLNTGLWEIAFACELFGRYFPAYLFYKLFEEEGKSQESIQKSLELLLKNKVVRSLDDPQPEIAGFVDNIENSIGERADVVRDMVKKRLLAWLSAGKLKPCFNLLETLHSLKFTPSALLVLEAIRQDIINGTYQDIEKSISAGTFNTICGEERSNAILYIYKTLKALNFGGEQEIRDTFRVPQATNITIDAYKAQILAINAIFKIGINDEKTALEEIKEAMLICQNNRDKMGLSQIYRIFSLLHFYNKEIREAMEYIGFAIEETEYRKDYDEQAIVFYYASSANFVFGNISKAQRLISHAEKAAVISGRKEWALRSKFLEGRYYFEIGLYVKAYNLFCLLVENWKKDTKQHTFMLNWINRTKLYINEIQKQQNEDTDQNTNTKHENILQDDPIESIIDTEFFNEEIQFYEGDGIIFEIEAAYIHADYKKTIELAEAVLELPAEGGFHFLEQPDWTSGFAQCELLLYSKKDYWHRLVTVWRSLAVCRLDKTRSHEAVHAMQQIMRDERLADIDPNAAFYFFANCKVLEATESNEVDRNTAISMAYKRLLRRATKIDDSDSRRTYLASQYWNQILANTAKEYKLN
ncbi:MAG: hypothetical protein Ta2F_12090 [Termitinemataceae bacterium]|nr:MAG: hypothetical protein Ta2F_12090 [Termitinemataceae bacterium]